MRVLVTGITGQDGYLLAEREMSRGHEVFGLVRGQRPVTGPEGAKLIQGDLLDQTSLIAALTYARPDVVYNFAAISSIGVSWSQASLTTEVTGLGVLRLLEAVRQVVPLAHVVHASTADMFGNYGQPATELTRFNPRTPYGIAKLYAHEVCATYREAYDLNVSTAIMYSHTSYRQHKGFVVPKICQAAARIKRDGDGELRLGNLTARRDWGWADDYVAAWPMIAGTRDDYVLATGLSHSIEDVVNMAFSVVDLDWTRYVRTDAAFIRPTDVAVQVGDPDKIKNELGWLPTVPLPHIVRRLVESEL
jgi:GDPmannose 4,6-dehydratase